jgi:uncharacterized protein YndB with AHSA1/START domain
VARRRRNRHDLFMPSYSAERELLASRQDVWAFLAEPTRLADWWPGLQGVHPDRRGLAPGARWQIQSRGRTNALVGPKFSVDGTIVFIEVEPPWLLSWQFIQDRYDVDLKLTGTEPDRTRARLTVTAPLFSGLRRSLPHRALTQLYALCQTGAQV